MKRKLKLSLFVFSPYFKFMYLHIKYGEINKEPDRSSL
jgi:hypothetical protein